MPDSDDQCDVTQKRVKTISTIAIYAMTLLIGVSAYLIAPSRYDVADQVGSDLRGVAYGPLCRGFGVGIGGLTSILILRFIHKQAAHVMFVLMISLCVLAVPFTRHLWQYLLSESGLGLFSSMYGANFNSWLLQMWQLNANPFMQAAHACHAVGTMIAPLLVAPFLSDKNSTIAYENETRIIIPFSIMSGILISMGIGLSVLFLKFPYTDFKREVSKKAGDNCRQIPSSKYYNMILVTLIGFLICSYVGVELTTLGFAATFVYNLPQGFSKADAAHVSSALSASFAVNRIVSIYIATRIKARTMMITSFVILMTGNILLLIFANNSPLMVWIAFVIIGKGHSPVYPCILSFVEERINVTTSVCSIFILSSSFSSIVIPIILGKFLEQNPLVYVYVNLLGLAVCAVVFMLIFWLDYRSSHKRTYEIIND